MYVGGKKIQCVASHHPAISFGSGCGGIRFSWTFQTSLTQVTHSSFLSGDFEVFLGQMGYIVPPAGFRSEPPQLVPFIAKEQQQLFSKLPLDARAPNPIFKAEPG